MRALSLWQPWAMFIALKLKQYETRHWEDRKVIGQYVAIHAAKKWDAVVKHDVVRLSKMPELSSLLVNGDGSLKTPVLQAMLCVVKVEAIHRTEDLEPSPLERAVGNWEPGRYAWELTVVEVFNPPIPTPGKQGIFNWPFVRPTVAGVSE